jgi:hypothetical protein
LVASVVVETVVAGFVVVGVGEVVTGESDVVGEFVVGGGVKSDETGPGLHTSATVPRPIHSLPVVTLKNPSSPQVSPQEFFIL